MIENNYKRISKMQIAKVIGLYAFSSFMFSKGIAAQNIDPAISKFPSSVVLRVIELNQRIDLSLPNQLWYANQLAKNETLISGKLADGVINVQQVTRLRDSLEGDIDLQFIKQLNEREKYGYELYLKELRPCPLFIDGQYLADAELKSQFGEALNAREKLNLSKKQVDSLIEKAIELKRNIAHSEKFPDSGFFDRAAFESASMSRILSERQYNDVLAAKNRAFSERLARNDWYEMKQLGITKNFTMDSTVQKLTVYYMLRSHITDAFAHQKERAALFIKSLNVPYPLRLLRQTKTGKNEKLAQYSW